MSVSVIIVVVFFLIINGVWKLIILF